MIVRLLIDAGVSMSVLIFGLYIALTIEEDEV